MNKEIIKKVEEIVKEKLKEDKTSHDWNHTKRVLENAKEIDKGNNKADLEIIILSCLLHDIAFQNKLTFEEIKKHNEIGAKQAKEILKKLNYPKEKIEKISKAILYHLRSIYGIKINAKKDFYEAQVLLDADNLMPWEE